MGTEFRDRRGRIIARRSWGGEREGVRVTLASEAAEWLREQRRGVRLYGDDGSETTLADLCEEIGNGGYLKSLGIKPR